MFFRPHRFIFNFGFGFNDADELMSPIGFLFVSLFIELSFEFVIDVMALQVEEKEVGFHTRVKFYSRSLHPTNRESTSMNFGACGAENRTRSRD